MNTKEVVQAHSLVTGYRQALGKISQLSMSEEGENM